MNTGGSLTIYMPQLNGFGHRRCRLLPKTGYIRSVAKDFFRHSVYLERKMSFSVLEDVYN